MEFNLQYTVQYMLLYIKHFAYLQTSLSWLNYQTGPHGLETLPAHREQSRLSKLPLRYWQQLMAQMFGNQHCHSLLPYHKDVCEKGKLFILT